MKSKISKFKMFIISKFIECETEHLKNFVVHNNISILHNSTWIYLGKKSTIYKTTVSTPGVLIFKLYFKS